MGNVQRPLHSPERQDPSLRRGRRTSTATERGLLPANRPAAKPGPAVAATFTVARAKIPCDSKSQEKSSLLRCIATALSIPLYNVAGRLTSRRGPSSILIAGMVARMVALAGLGLVQVFPLSAEELPIGSGTLVWACLPRWLLPWRLCFIYDVLREKRQPLM